MPLKHRKVIIIAGISRGGTNILWNIVQSHPQVCSTIKELTEELNPTDKPRIRSLIDFSLASPIAQIPGIRNLIVNWMDERFYQSKMSGGFDVYAREKYEGVSYTEDEIQNAVLCLKATDRDIYLIDMLVRSYEDVRIINIVRNGYAVADSWRRRGQPITKAAKRYKHYMKILKGFEERYGALTIRFEDLITDPFLYAERVYGFANLDPVRLDKIRLKTKLIVTDTGDYQATYGNTGSKHWFTRETIQHALVADQSAIQRGRLSPEDIQIFDTVAGDTMRMLGY